MNAKTLETNSAYAKFDVDGDGVERATEALCTTLAPKGSRIEVHYERIWIADDYSVYFSTANDDGFDIEDWTAPTYPTTEVNQHGGEISIYTNDGGKIIGLRVIFDDILIYKQNNIFKIFGNYPGQYTKVQIFSANGGISDRSIVASNEGSFFLNRDNIYLYNGTQVQPISFKVKSTIGNINLAYALLSCGVVFNSKYILAIPSGSSTKNNLIIEYDIYNKTFILKNGFEVSSFLIFDNKLLFVNDDGKVYQYEMNTTSRESYWLSGKTDLNSPESTKETEYIYFYGKGGKAKVSLITENKTVSKEITLTSFLTPYRTVLKNKGRILQLKIENVSTEGIYSNFTIVKPNIMLDTDLD